MIIVTTACDECGALTDPQYADDHAGLCGRCFHRDRRSEAVGPDPIRDAIERETHALFKDIGGDS